MTLATQINEALKNGKKVLVDNWGGQTVFTKKDAGHFATGASGMTLYIKNGRVTRFWHPETPFTVEG